MVVGSLLVVALPTVDSAEVEQRISFPDPVAELAGEGECLLKVVGSLPVVTLPAVDGSNCQDLWIKIF